MNSTLLNDRNGAVAILAAAAMGVFMSFSAVAVDIGMLFLERRHAQGAVDLAAMAAASDLQNAEFAAKTVLAANEIENYTHLDVVTGHYRADPSIEPANRFQPDVAPINAARVTMNKPGRTYFAKIFHSDSVDIGVTGLASNADYATFSVGTRLLAIRDGFPNQILGALLGTQLNLSVADYEALLDAEVKIFPLLEALNTEADLQAATYNDVLSGEATVSDLLRAAADVSDASGHTTAAAAFRTIAFASAHDIPLDLGKLFDLGPAGKAALGTQAPGFDAAASALEILSTTAVIANGKNQVAVDLGANVLGLAAVKLDIAIGEPPVRSPWVQVGQPGATLYTSQIRIRLIAEVGGTGLLSGVNVRIPLYIESAYATARLAAVSCFENKGVTVAAQPGVVSAHLADVIGFGATAAKPTITKARLAKLPLAEVFGRGTLAIEDVSETELFFSPADIENQTIHRVDTSDFSQSIVSSLLRETQLDVQALGFSLTLPSGLGSAVATTLQTAAAPLDALVSGLLTSLGVHMGEADVRVHGIHCGGGGYLAG